MLHNLYNLEGVSGKLHPLGSRNDRMIHTLTILIQYIIRDYKEGGKKSIRKALMIKKRSN